MYKEILNSLVEPIIFCDVEHVIVFMNAAALERHKDENLLGSSIFDCHNENSNRIIKEIFSEMQNGLEEKKIVDNDERRVFMRAVRDDAGRLLGYYERFEYK